MKTHTQKLHRWIGTFIDRGAVFDLAGPYVVGTSGGDFTVDVEHATYPTRPLTRPEGENPASVRVSRPAGRTTADLWEEMCVRAGKPVADPAAEIEWLASRGKATGCGVCRKHWRALLATYPPAIERPESYTAWVWFVRNLIATEKGRPWYPYSRVAAVYGWPA